MMTKLKQKRGSPTHSVDLCLSGGVSGSQNDLIRINWTSAHGALKKSLRSIKRCGWETHFTSVLIQGIIRLWNQWTGIVALCGSPNGWRPCVASSFIHRRHEQTEEKPLISAGRATLRNYDFYRNPFALLLIIPLIPLFIKWWRSEIQFN